MAGSLVTALATLPSNRRIADRPDRVAFAVEEMEAPDPSKIVLAPEDEEMLPRTSVESAPHPQSFSSLGSGGERRSRQCFSQQFPVRRPGQQPAAGPAANEPEPVSADVTGQCPEQSQQGCDGVRDRYNRPDRIAFAAARDHLQDFKELCSQDGELEVGGMKIARSMPACMHRSISVVSTGPMALTSSLLLPGQRNWRRPAALGQNRLAPPASMSTGSIAPAGQAGGQPENAVAKQWSSPLPGKSAVPAAPQGGRDADQPSFRKAQARRSLTMAPVDTIAEAVAEVVVEVAAAPGTSSSMPRPGKYARSVSFGVVSLGGLAASLYSPRTQESRGSAPSPAWTSEATATQSSSSALTSSTAAATTASGSGSDDDPGDRRSHSIPVLPEPSTPKTPRRRTGRARAWGSFSSALPAPTPGGGPAAASDVAVRYADLSALLSGAALASGGTASSPSSSEAAAVRRPDSPKAPHQGAGTSRPRGSRSASVEVAGTAAPQYGPEGASDIVVHYSGLASLLDGAQPAASLALNGSRPRRRSAGARLAALPSAVLRMAAGALGAEPPYGAAGPDVALTESGALQTDAPPARPTR